MSLFRTLARVVAGNALILHGRGTAFRDHVQLADRDFLILRAGLRGFVPGLSRASGTGAAALRRAAPIPAVLDASLNSNPMSYMLAQILRRTKSDRLAAIRLQEILGLLTDDTAFQAGLTGGTCPGLRHSAACGRISLSCRRILRVALRTRAGTRGRCLVRRTGAWGGVALRQGAKDCCQNQRQRERE